MTRKEMVNEIYEHIRIEYQILTGVHTLHYYADEHYEITTIAQDYETREQACLRFAEWLYEHGHIVK